MTKIIPNEPAKKPYSTAKRMRAGLRCIHPEPASNVVEIAPRISARAARMVDEGFSPDEISSVETFLFGRLVETPAMAEDRTPWDEYTPGGDAA